MREISGRYKFGEEFALSIDGDRRPRARSRIALRASWCQRIHTQAGWCWSLFSSRSCEQAQAPATCPSAWYSVSPMLAAGCSRVWILPPHLPHTVRTGNFLEGRFRVPNAPTASPSSLPTNHHHLQQYHTTTTTTKKPTIQSFPYPPNTPTDPTLQPTHITHRKPWSLQWKLEVGR